MNRLVWDDDHRGPPPPPPARPERPPRGDGIVRIRREVGGRGGKTVTTIEGLGLAPPQLEQFARECKQRFGCGGSVDGFVVVLQGDRRDAVEAFLRGKGYV